MEKKENGILGSVLISLSHSRHSHLDWESYTDLCKIPAFAGMTAFFDLKLRQYRILEIHIVSYFEVSLGVFKSVAGEIQHEVNTAAAKEFILNQ